jgi:cytidylate kinase
MTSAEPNGDMLGERLAPPEQSESPRHGFRGDPGSPKSARFQPARLTVAVSREAGARGSTIARRAAAKLGWQVYSQELLEHISQEGSFRQTLVENLPPGGLRWVEQRLELLLSEQHLSRHPSVVDMTRIILGLGAQGDVILVGRGAGCVLPRESTLHVRVVATLEDRIAYMSQWLRLTIPEATTQVRLRDERRAEFLATHFHRQVADVYQYDLLLNSSLLGEELCAELIVQAARAKQDRREV